MCAAIAAGEHGDARRALDLIRVAGELAERNGDAEVTESHIRAAQNKVEHDRVTEVLTSLPLHLKIVLISVFLFTKHSKNEAVTGDIYAIYQELSKEIKVDSIRHKTCKYNAKRLWWKNRWC